jgi:hypothetical protein
MGKDENGKRDNPKTDWNQYSVKELIDKMKSGDFNRLTCDAINLVVLEKLANNSNKNIAQNIVEKIIDDISDRSGIGNEWECLDEDIQDEIREVWVKIIEKEIATG